MTQKTLVDRFCTPPPIAETDYDRKATADAEVIEIPFEGYSLQGYAWGTGKQVLLTHGWGSRASHLAPLGRRLAKSGFRVFAFDGPSHGNSLKHGPKQHSSMFEFCRAFSAVAQTIPPVYAVVGHSLGAISAIFTIAGYAGLAPYKINTERMVSISAPASVASIIERFSRQHNLNTEHTATLTRGLEQDFHFSVAEYYLPRALKKLDTEILFIHDEDDDEIPVEDAARLHEAHADGQLILTQGAGHQRILANRTMIRAATKFLSSDS